MRKFSASSATAAFFSGFAMGLLPTHESFEVLAPNKKRPGARHGTHAYVTYENCRVPARAALAGTSGNSCESPTSGLRQRPAYGSAPASTKSGRGRHSGNNQTAGAS